MKKIIVKKDIEKNIEIGVYKDADIIEVYGVLHGTTYTRNYQLEKVGNGISISEFRCGRLYDEWVVPTYDLSAMLKSALKWVREEIYLTYEMYSW